MDAYRVIRHPGDEDEGARWACRARQQRGPVEIASGLAPAVLRPGRTWLSASTGGEILFLPRLALLVGLQTGVWPRMGVPGERMTEESYATLSWNQPPVKFKAERRFRGWCFGSREGVLVLTIQKSYGFVNSGAIHMSDRKLSEWCVKWLLSYFLWPSPFSH